MKDNSASLAHVGIIPDGNRRWARTNNLDLDAAYWIAMQKLTMTIDTLIDLGASSVTVYLLSRENVERARDDLEAVLRAEERLIRELLPILKRKHGLRVFLAGNPALLPQTYLDSLNALTESPDVLRTSLPSLFLCAGYDPIDEIFQCIANFTGGRSELLRFLWVPHEIDLVIRTGGDQRLSGFVPLQCKYAELFFEPYYFPDISRERIEAIVTSYHLRERRFGK